MSEPFTGKITPEGVSTEVLSTLRMLAKVPQISPDVRQKNVPSTEGKILLQLVNNSAIEEQEHQRARQSAELSTQKLGKTFIFDCFDIIRLLIVHVMCVSDGKLVPPIQSTSMLAQTSGGSSPSREVQEILSLKDFDFLSEEFVDDDPNELLDDIDGESVENKLIPDESYIFNDNTCTMTMIFVVFLFSLNFFVANNFVFWIFYFFLSDQQKRDH